MKLLCSRCNTEEVDAKGKYCRACQREYLRAWRKRKKKEKVEKAFELPKTNEEMLPAIRVVMFEAKIMPDGRKKCGQCLEIKPIDQFNDYDRKCKTCRYYTDQ